MPILTVEEARSLMQVAKTDVSKDTVIKDMLPLLQDEVVRRCNNDFLDLRRQRFTTGVSFVPIDGDTPAMIVDADDGFVTAGFRDGCDVHVSGTLFNDGVYSVATVTASALTLEAEVDLEDEDAGDLITVTVVKWPAGIKLEAANVLKYYLTKEGKLVKDETLPGGYRAVFKSGDEVWCALDRHRRVFR